MKGLEQNPQKSPIYNKTEWTLRRVYEEDHTLLADNFRDYINGFSENVQDIIEHFNYRATIAQMVKNNRLAPILNQYKELDLGPDRLSNLEMGYVYEELLRRFSEQSGEEAGEHFTPREVIRLMLPDQLFYNTGIFTYVWLLRNEKPASHRGRVMLIDARKQFEKEPKSFGNKRNRITEAQRAWIAQRHRDGWAASYQGDDVKLFKTTDFAYHKVSVVFWQTDENDEPAIITEPYPKAFTVANIAKEQAFYASDLSFTVRLTEPATGRAAIVAFTLAPDESFPKVFEKAARDVFAAEIEAATKDAADKKKAAKRFLDVLQAEAEWTHRHYVKGDEYIPYGEDIEAFLRREIAKPIIRWEDSKQLGYEILPNKYFYRYQPPTPAKDLLAEFWRLEKEAEKMLEGLAAGAH